MIGCRPLVDTSTGRAIRIHREIWCEVHHRPIDDCTSIETGDFSRKDVIGIIVLVLLIVAAGYGLWFLMAMPIPDLPRWMTY